MAQTELLRELPGTLDPPSVFLLNCVIVSSSVSAPFSDKMANSTICCCFLLFSRSVVSDSLATPWTVACQAPMSIEFSRQEYWNGLPFPPPGDLPNSGIEPTSPAMAGRFCTTEPLGKYVIPQLAVIKPSLKYLTEVISLLTLQTAWKWKY